MQRDSNVSRRELEARLLDKAWKDAAFRRALLDDPKGTLERELEVRVPEGFSLTVLEETPTSRYVILPPRPRSGDVELSDAELDAVAGGSTVSTFCAGQSCYTANTSCIELGCADPTGH
jgi:hypothetical protein